MKKPATLEQIADWTRALVELKRASLPWDHPHRSVGPGRYPYATHYRAAAAATARMRAHGIALPPDAELLRLAEGGIDLEAFRAHRALVAEVNAMLRALEAAHALDVATLAALADALRPVADRLRAALAAAEEKST